MFIKEDAKKQLLCNLRDFLPLVIVGLLSSQVLIVDYFGNICKPIALSILELFGLETLDEGTHFKVAHLIIPWTRDCAGMNILLVLLCIFCWVNLRSKYDRNYFLRLFFVFWAAVFVNVLRIITLVIYRYVVYPEVESQQLHYFFGLIWVIPFAMLSLIWSERANRKQNLWFEMLHISAIISLLAPYINLNNHWMTVIASFVILFKSDYKEGLNSRSIKLLISWSVVAFLISWSAIESLWLPWLLVCPFAVNNKWIISPVGIACLVVSCPLFVLLPGAELIASLIFVLSYREISGNKKAQKLDFSINSKNRLKTSFLIFVAFLLFMPFVTAIAFTPDTLKLAPPEIADKKKIEGVGYQLRVKGQSSKMGLLWYYAQGSDRHHTIDVCLKYRGIDLVDSEVPLVKTDGRRWFREYFVVQKNIISEHNKYIWNTLGFQRDPGVHLIFVGNCESFDAQMFANETEGVAKELFKGLSFQWL